MYNSDIKMLFAFQEKIRVFFYGQNFIWSRDSSLIGNN